MSKRGEGAVMSPYNINFTLAQRRVVADLLPKLADRMKLDEKNPGTIAFTIQELESIRTQAEAARSHVQNGMVRNSLRHVVDAVTQAVEEVEGIGSHWTCFRETLHPISTQRAKTTETDGASFDPASLLSFDQRSTNGSTPHAFWGKSSPLPSTKIEDEGSKKRSVFDAQSILKTTNFDVEKIPVWRSLAKPNSRFYCE